jgi:hypothetical protein
MTVEGMIPQNAVPDSTRQKACNRPQRPRGGVEVQLYSFFNLGSRRRWVVNATPRPLYPGKDPALIV